MVLVSAMNPGNKDHKTGMAYLKGLRTSESIRIPTSSLIEFDLVMRNNGYTESESAETWIALAAFVERNFIATTLSAHWAAAGMRVKGLTYFDSLIAALAKEMSATVITRDAEISKHVDTEWEPR
jgi:predicted nucleic acid-binding protein